MPKTENISSTSDGDCIVMLTNAEKKARKVIEAAKKRKVALMKKAKEESASEIEIFRRENEQFVNKLFKEYSSGQKKDVGQIEESYETKRAHLFQQFELNQKATLDFVLELVVKVEPKAHGNLVI